MKQVRFAEKGVVVLSAALSAAIFIFDLTLPLGVAGGVPYVAPVLLSLWAPGLRYIIVMAVVGSLLTLAGLVLSPAGGMLWVVLLNRMLALFAIWVTALLTLKYKHGELALYRAQQELSVANQELEAFCYAVSHDLRAPLRGINGFSQALLEDCALSVDDRAGTYARRIRAACQRMGDLIDDLLALSRLTRSEIVRQTVDISALVRTIAEELRRTQPQRSVHFVIEDRLTASADARLLRIALENLLGNAWKFTQKRGHARIECGATRRGGEMVYFVRDNGAGFNMAHGDKLFGAFQRLHGATEFEGEGIGLATVERVIRRHGGRIWGEGEIDKGATFYFTLQREGAVKK